jgi:L-ascorbate metabolism protein UlaG (beta-lactamase superfamily)
MFLIKRTLLRLCQVALLCISILTIFILFVGFINRPGKHKSGRPAHMLENGFRNPWPTSSDRSFADFMKWQMDRWRGKAPKKPSSYNFTTVENDGGFLRENTSATTVTWVGHATTLLQIDGVNILTDPIWSEHATPVSWTGPPRVVPPVPAFDDLPKIDIVVVSHNHYDHLDKPTIQRLGNAAHYFVPLLMAKWLRGLGIKNENITELDWWQEAERRGLKIVCTPTQHFSGRGLHDRNQVLWCSWTILGKTQRLYFAGDTGYFPGFGEIGEKFGPFDAAILPIGAYLPRWFMSSVHVDPPQAAQAFLDLRARVFVPIHWGTFDLADEPMDQPPQLLLAAADSLQIPRESIWLMRPGETRTF